MLHDHLLHEDFRTDETCLIRHSLSLRCEFAIGAISRFSQFPNVGDSRGTRASSALCGDTCIAGLRGALASVAIASSPLRTQTSSVVHVARSCAKRRTRSRLRWRATHATLRVRPASSTAGHGTTRLDPQSTSQRGRWHRARYAWSSGRQPFWFRGDLMEVEAARTSTQ